MREILFRGKRVNGEWIKGFYIEANHHWHNKGVHKEWIVKNVIQNGGWCNVGSKYAVIPETVGQYTGLTDKNGVKIFEGDLLKPFDDAFDYMEVVYVNGCFMIEINALQGMMMEYGWDETAGGHGVLECEPFPFYSENIEVIGNIYDNKELLGG